MLKSTADGAPGFVNAAGITNWPRIGRLGKEIWLMPVLDGSHALDHVVVVLFENRSFDNVLGHLYGPEDGKSFDGVIGKDLSNPIPGWAEHGAERKVVPYTVATDMDSPNPDSGATGSRFRAAQSCGLQVCGRRPVDSRTKGERALPLRPAAPRPEAELRDDSCTAHRPTTVDGHLAVLYLAGAAQGKETIMCPMPGDDMTPSVTPGPRPSHHSGPGYVANPKAPDFELVECRC